MLELLCQLLCGRDQDVSSRNASCKLDRKFRHLPFRSPNPWAQQGERQYLQLRSRSVDALPGVDDFNFDNPGRMQPYGFDRMDKVPAVANEPALDCSRH